MLATSLAVELPSTFSYVVGVVRRALRPRPPAPARSSLCKIHTILCREGEGEGARVRDRLRCQECAPCCSAVADRRV